MNFRITAKFQAELKRLTKKYRSLPEDIEEFERIVSTIPLGNSRHFAILHREENLYIIKARLFCRYLKGSSYLRIVYAYYEKKATIELIELYFKGEREREDQQRIEEYLSVQKSGKPV